MRTPPGPPRTLARRLHELADEEPPRADAADGRDLWARGRRRHLRQQVAAGALSLLLVLGLGSLTAAVVTSVREGVVPADAGAVLGLPDRLSTPSPWLGGTDGRGPLGPLVAVLGAERRSLGAGASNALVGVSATGEYAFLDLPDLADDPSGVGLDLPVALSADGRFVAYPSSDAGDDLVTGVSVYDSVTGDVERRALRGELGRTADVLGWVGHRLYVDFFEVTERTADTLSAEQVDPFVWDVDTGSASAVGGGLVDLVAGATAVPGGESVVAVHQERVVAVDAAGRRRPLVTLDRDRGDRVAVSPDGGRAAVGEADVSDGRSGVWVADVDGPAAGQTRAVPGLADDDELVAWRDASHVVVHAYGEQAYVSVDVETGERETVLALDDVTWAPGPHVAADAWQGPAFDAPAPDRPLDPVLLVQLGGGVLVLLLALWLLRRRMHVGP